MSQEQPCQIFRAQYERKKDETQEERYEQDQGRQGNNIVVLFRIELKFQSTGFFGMMAEIKTVVSHHLVNVNDEFKDTMDVLNTLPLVVHLKQLVNKLSIEKDRYVSWKHSLTDWSKIEEIEVKPREVNP